MNRDERSNALNRRTRRETGNSRYVGIDVLQEYLGLGRASAVKIAEAAQAVVRIGRRVVYDLTKIDAYMETLAG